MSTAHYGAFLEACLSHRPLPSKSYTRTRRGAWAAAARAALVVSPRREHSRKPDEVRERIVWVFGDVPRAELFARQRVPAWQAWGNEVQCDFEL